MTATCTNCETTFYHVDRKEHGSLTIESTRCAHPGCEVYLCRACCEHLSFKCDGCGKCICGEHKVTFDGFPFCLGCAVAEVENQEPECECQQTDVDTFDAAGCEFHNPASQRNVRLRAVTAIQQYQQHTKTKGEKSMGWLNGRDSAGASVPPQLCSACN
jgi:hypothetical protein